MPKKWKLALMGLSSMLFICLTSCAMMGAIGVAMAGLLGAPPAQ
jgi:hypothetical protein